MQIPQSIKTTITKLQEAGYEAYLVGGAVRDSLVGIEPGDWDVATAALPEQVTALFPQTIPTGLKYGTVTVVWPDCHVQVTTFRREGRYADNRRPAEVKLGVTLLEDLARRDFTVNAIAYDPLARCYIDPFNGRAALLPGEIRLQTVGDPLTTFRDDALRLLRVFSLLAKLAAHGKRVVIAAEVQAAVRREAYRLQAIASERVQKELNKILTAPRPGACLQAMAEAGLLQQLLPELDAAPHRHPWTAGKGENPFGALDRLSPELTLRLAALLAVTIGGPWPEKGGEDKATASTGLAKAVLTRMKYSGAVASTVVHLLQNLNFIIPGSPAEVRRFINKVGKRKVQDLLQLRRALAGEQGQGTITALEQLSHKVDTIFKGGDAVEIRDLQVNGHDLLRALDIPPGTMVGQILRSLLERVLDNPQLNEHTMLLKLAQELLAGDIPQL